MPHKPKPLNSTQLAALREALDNATGRITRGDNGARKALVARGFAVALDLDGRLIHEIDRRDVVFATIEADHVAMEHPAPPTYYFITPLGRERAKFAADVAARPTCGLGPVPELMQDL